MASFAGHSFNERGSAGHDNPSWDSKYVLVTKIIPNGSPVIQAIGADVQRMAMPIRCSSSQLAALRGDCDGDSHTLSWSGGSDSAILESIGSPAEVMPGYDYFFAVLNLIKA